MEAQATIGGKFGKNGVHERSANFMMGGNQYFYIGSVMNLIGHFMVLM